MSNHAAQPTKSSKATTLQKNGSAYRVSVSSKEPDTLNPRRIDADDLFSLFTASIIKKHTTFTR